MSPLLFWLENIATASEQKEKLQNGKTNDNDPAKKQLECF